MPLADPFNTRSVLAAEAGVSEGTLFNYLTIKENANPELLEKVKRGEIKIGTAHRMLETEIVKSLKRADGLLRFIALSTLLLQPPDELPPLVVIDEPELGLHPYAVQVLAALLRKASHHTQVLVATQSVTLVDQFEPADIVVVEREDGVSTLKRLNAEDLKGWMEEYSLGELWEKNIFGGRPS